MTFSEITLQSAAIGPWGFTIGADGSKEPSHTRTRLPVFLTKPYLSTSLLRPSGIDPKIWTVEMEGLSRLPNIFEAPASIRELPRNPVFSAIVFNDSLVSLKLGTEKPKRLTNLPVPSGTVDT